MNRASFVIALLAASMTFGAHAGIGMQDSSRQVGEPVLEPAVVKQPVVRKSRFATPEESGQANAVKRSPMLRSLRYASAEEMPVTAPDQDVHRDNCLRFTGSRLLRDDRSSQRCAIGGGQVYMRDDIDRAGAGTLIDVLRR
ncbi:MAG: hypothetical protein ACREO7_06485 [Pseudoxanthomonas sp.]